MGGIAKGLLVAPDGEPIVLRTRRLLEQIGAECVLVGAHPAYHDVDLATVPDDPRSEGPLAGLLALLEHASGSTALAIACDMPLFDQALLNRLVDAPPAPIVAPRRRAEERGRDLWEPLFARYEPSVLPIARDLALGGERRLQRLLDVAGARALSLTAEEAALLVDWDTLPDATLHERSER